MKTQNSFMILITRMGGRGGEIVTMMCHLQEAKINFAKMSISET